MQILTNKQTKNQDFVHLVVVVFVYSNMCNLRRELQCCVYICYCDWNQQSINPNSHAPFSFLLFQIIFRCENPEPHETQLCVLVMQVLSAFQACMMSRYLGLLIGNSVAYFRCTVLVTTIGYAVTAFKCQVVSEIYLKQ